MEIVEYFLDKNNPMVALLILAIISLIAFIKIVDNRNMKLTNERVDDLKSDIKELKDENKQDKLLFTQAINTFQKSTEEFTKLGNDLAEIKSDIKGIDKDIVAIKSKMEK